MTSSNDGLPHDVSPHDRARLYDLLDGRLTPTEADDVRRRLHDDAAYAALHAECVALRDAIEAQPLPTSPRASATSPTDFLAAVRRAAGLPPSAPTALPSLATPSADVVPRRVTASFTRWALPLAAGIGLALGAGLYFAGDLDQAPARTLEAAHAGDARPGETGGTNAVAKPDAGNASDARVGELDRLQADGKEGRPAAGAVASGPFRAPGGAVRPGLRLPADAPAPTGPAPQPEPARTDLSGQVSDDLAGGGAEIDPQWDSAERARALRRRVRKETPSAPPDRDKAGAPPPSDPEGSHAEKSLESKDADAPAPSPRVSTPPARGAKRQGGGAGGATVALVVSEDVVMRASSLDEARATLTLFLNQASAPAQAPLPPPEGAPAAPQRDRPAPLGVFVVDVPAGVDLSALGVVAPPAKDAARGSATRRVRVVVVPR